MFFNAYACRPLHSGSAGAMPLVVLAHLGFIADHQMPPKPSALSCGEATSAGTVSALPVSKSKRLAPRLSGALAPLWLRCERHPGTMVDVWCQTPYEDPGGDGGQMRCNCSLYGKGSGGHGCLVPTPQLADLPPCTPGQAVAPHVRMKPLVVRHVSVCILEGNKAAGTGSGRHLRGSGKVSCLGI